jgi:purine-nucleoside phosphorylase
MTEQRKKISETTAQLKKHLPQNYRAKIALIIEENYKLPKEFEILKKINLKNVPATINKDIYDDSFSLLFSKVGNINVLILKSRLHFFDGVHMREIAHFIYTLKYLGVEKIISIDEVGNLNPRFKLGDITLIYDHINLMGDNPLIGENDEELGIRFPDMSNAYDSALFDKASKVLIENKIKINESVYLGLIGPESETEAEARFYREIGSDVLGYSIVPENITAVHAKMKFLAIGLLTRDLIADKMKEDNSAEKEKEIISNKHFKKAVGTSNKILVSLIKSI